MKIYLMVRLFIFIMIMIKFKLHEYYYIEKGYEYVKEKNIRKKVLALTFLIMLLIIPIVGSIIFFSLIFKSDEEVLKELIKEGTLIKQEEIWRIKLR